ncbi:DUF554 domain-containing protein [Anaerophaga thermohalophila]|jgi:hypothetical protein|uniref:DUF554 domain-containing protein n=1 Tax=Anaerophaga thermohalophila TaxID=177400 RepID=UPI00030D681C|nr:DUF554 domain-containing protein [Anaerophaga thermohalophila]
MIGTLVNVGTVVAGSVLGVIFRHRLPRRVVTVVFQGIGLFTIGLGVSMFLESQWILVVVLSLLFGGITGGALKLEEKMGGLSERLKHRFRFKDERFTEGLITSFLLFCMGSLTILGAIEEGIGNGPELLITKSVLDGFSSMALAAAMGIGVLFSVIPLLIYQGGITLLSMWLGNFFAQSVVNELTATGGVLLIGLGLNILNVAKIKVTDLLPSLLFVVLFAWMKYAAIFPFALF